MKIKRLLKSKRGEGVFGMSFSMIFSIILIIFFIMAAFMAIRFFMNFQKKSQVGFFLDDLQNSIDKAWQGQESSFNFEKALPSGIDYVCFINLTEPVIGADPVEEEVIIGAKGTLTDTESNEAFEAETDNFGDFWFRGLKDDRTFSLKLEKDGKSITIDAISTDDDRNLGDIPFE